MTGETHEIQTIPYIAHEMSEHRHAKREGKLMAIIALLSTLFAACSLALLLGAAVSGG